MIAITIRGLPIRTKAEKSSGRHHLGAEHGKIELRPQADEEEEQQEIAQADQSCGNRLAEGGGGQGDAGKKGADLLAEAESIAHGGQQDGPGDGEQQEQFLGAGQVCQEAWQDKAHHQAHPAEESRALEQDQEAVGQRWPDASPAPRAVRPIIARMTAMSWTMRKPTAMRPCRASISRLSESSLTMMMVLEKVRATATYKAPTGESPGPGR
jgi:hypothetical protein